MIVRLLKIFYLVKEFRIERIISTGQISDWFDQADNELVMLLQGSAKIEYETGL